MYIGFCRETERLFFPTSIFVSAAPAATTPTRICNPNPDPNERPHCLLCRGFVVFGKSLGGVRAHLRNLACTGRCTLCPFLLSVLGMDHRHAHPVTALVSYLVVFSDADAVVYTWALNGRCYCCCRISLPHHQPSLIHYPSFHHPSSVTHHSIIHQPWSIVSPSMNITPSSITHPIVPSPITHRPSPSIHHLSPVIHPSSIAYHSITFYHPSSIIPAIAHHPSFIIPAMTITPLSLHHPLFFFNHPSSITLRPIIHHLSPMACPLQLDHDIDPLPSSGPKPSLLDGESLTNVVAPIAYALARKRGGGGEFDGALHITNFRLILQRTGPGKVGGLGV